MVDTVEGSTATVQIDRSPPRRVLMPTRWRSFKTGPDRDIWKACWAPVRVLLDEGWRIETIFIDWGASKPETRAWREQAIRDLCGCYDGCRVVESAGDIGRGRMFVEMTRDDT